jgi:hypothetical protein
MTNIYRVWGRVYGLMRTHENPGTLLQVTESVHEAQGLR